jgi:integrase/recombinase XerD
MSDNRDPEPEVDQQKARPPHLVQPTLGHASLATTGRYTHARPNDSNTRYLPDGK